MKSSEIYQAVTNRIITELEAGRVPRAHPWGTPNVKAANRAIFRAASQASKAADFIQAFRETVKTAREDTG